MDGTVARRKTWKVLLGQMAAGAVVGAAATAGMLMLWKDRGLDPEDPAQMLALVAGMVYALMGLAVGLGALAPRTGAQFLNVEDADELRDERPVITVSAVACVAIGVLFLTLAAMPAGGAGGMLGRESAAVIVGACLVVLAVTTRMTSRRADELTRQVSLEASSVTLLVITLALAGWGALAHLGYAAWVGPLALLASLALLQLAAVFWVAGRKGMLVRR